MFDFKKTVDSVLNRTHTEAAAIALEHHKNAAIAEVTQLAEKLDAQKKDLYAQIGEKYHSMTAEGSFTGDAVAELQEQVNKINQQIDEGKEKLESIKAKFANDMQAIKGGVAGKKHNCPKCGKEFVVGEDSFCTECGENLKDVTPEEPLCPSCGEAYDPETAKFCRKCGNPLTKSDAVN